MSYENLDEEEKEKVKMILYIMDRFSISLDGYHELTQTQPELPRTHIIESCAKTLDSKWKVTRTAGVAQGAELPLKLLLEEEIRKHVSTCITHFTAIIVKFGFLWVFTQV